VNDLTDQQLLRDYAERQSETAFAELVRRHVDLVYSAALRMVRDSHLAQDVTQAVFLALAQNARQLTNRPVLSGWLHRTAQNLASKSVRTEVRRRAREQEAFAMNELLANETDADWKNIAPHLDTALGELSEPDRDALLLHYFERKSAREMAAILSLSEEAAQKRVNRAVERLRELFSKRNVTIGASGLVVLISANAVQAAPIGLLATISTAISLAGTAIQTSTAIAATKTIAMTTLQKTLITTVLVVAAGAGIYEARRSANLQKQIRSLAQQQAPLLERIKQLQTELQSARDKLVSAQDENELLRRNTSELPRLRGEVARLRKDSQDLAQLRSSEQAGNNPTQAAMKSWLARVDQLKQRMQDFPEQNIPELQFVTEQDWLSAAQGKLETDDDFRRAMSALRGAAENKFGNMLQPALKKYMSANGDKFPTDLSQLQPYFKSAVDDAILQRYAILPATDLPYMKVGTGDWIISQRTAVDQDFDSRIVVGPNGWGSTGGAWKAARPLNVLTPPLRKYESAHNGNGPDDPSQLLRYLKTQEEKTALQNLSPVVDPRHLEENGHK
jgi:RNA polymerase sigma factor (sigma-70 family)